MRNLYPLAGSKSAVSYGPVFYCALADPIKGALPNRKRTDYLPGTVRPYILELAENAARNHEPILRHLAYEFPDQGYERELSMYMLGSRYLVVPMLEKGRKTRTVTLPKGQWKESDGTQYTGGKPLELEFPLEKVYVYERQA